LFCSEAAVSYIHNFITTRNNFNIFQIWPYKIW